MPAFCGTLGRGIFVSGGQMKRRKKLRICTAIFVFCILCLLILLQRTSQIGKEQQAQATPKESIQIYTAEPEKPAETPQTTPEATKDPTDGIYSYLQGPKSWKRRITWSGEWGEQIHDGGSFGGFGCGLCCMANVYSSMTEYACSPLDIYHYTKKKTYYSGGMAVEWGYMRRTLTSLGFDCAVRRKPDSYQKFKRAIAGAECAIVLVSSGDSDEYWKHTPGHYVTLFLYDRQNEKVFLADSGVPEHNRQWVSLKKIYRSLKTGSSWQYLRVGQYHQKKDHWKHKTASGDWVRPE